MLTRRSLFFFAAALAPAGLSVAAVAASLSGEAAVDFVKQSAGRLAAILAEPGEQAGKQQRLLQIVDQTVDVDGIGRFVLGRFWRIATPQQQQQYLTLFHQALLRSVTARIGEYQGVKIQVGRAIPAGDGTAVQSTILRPGQAPLSVQWLVGDVGGAPKIIDVQAEGTSMRLTERSDYTSFLQQHGGSVQALIEALRRQQQNAG